MHRREHVLGDVLEFHDQLRVPLSSLERDTRQGEYRYYGAQGVIDHIDNYIYDGQFVLIAEDGANLVTRNEPIAFLVEGQFWVNNHAHVVKGKEGVADDYYVTRLLNSMNIAGFITGAAQPKLSQQNLRQIKILLPAYDAQRRIADILSTYDDLIENNRRRMTLLEDAARQLYREWFVRLRFPGHEHSRITNGVPEGWTAGVVADFYYTASGGTPSRKRPEYFTGEIPWVKTQELANNFIIDTDEKITEDGLNSSAARLFPERTVLVALYGATVGELGILANASSTNQACCAILPKDVRAHYIHAFLFLAENKERLRNLSAGAAQKNISQEIIRDVEMVLPPKPVMDVFIDSLNPTFDQRLNLERQNDKLRVARDLLLPRLMSGEIAV